MSKQLPETDLIDLSDDKDADSQRSSPVILTKHPNKHNTGKGRKGEEKVQEKGSKGGHESPSHSIGDSLSLNSNDSNDPRRLVPWVNCQEKIILCLDLSNEMNEKSFPSKKAPDFTAYQFVRKAAKIFVNNKAMLNSIHEFGVITLADDATWYQQFESNPDMICTLLDHLNPSEEDNQDTFDMEKLFQTICQRIALPEVEDPALPPPYVIRVIMIYGRSHCPPHFTDRSRQMLRELLQSPYFFFDVLYVHELPSENNQCEAIYDSFCELDEDEDGYMLEVSRSTSRLFDHMAILLAHPLQRPKQRDTFYELQNRDDNETT
ncbi:BRISC and BRCA1-A complex member 1 isoform X1 [Nematostella vectensis]|nr:BRISC and BRCA1-A complex member 1 isoform X1 [Nematostella vectensis]